MSARMQLVVDGVTFYGTGRVVASFNPEELEGRPLTVSAEVVSYDAAPVPEPRPVTGREGMRAILAEINNAPDPLAEAGLWLTHLTNQITKIIREDDQK